MVWERDKTDGIYNHEPCYQKNKLYLPNRTSSFSSSGLTSHTTFPHFWVICGVWLARPSSTCNCLQDWYMPGSTLRWGGRPRRMGWAQASLPQRMLHVHHTLQLHPGTHGDPFLQEQPFMRKSIVSCICCWSRGHSQSTEYSLLWIFHPLCSGGRSTKGPCSWALWQSCATQQERSQCHHIEVCEGILSSVSMVQSVCGLSVCSELSIYIIRNIWTKLVVVLHGSQIVLWLGIALHAICI